MKKAIKPKMILMAFFITNLALCILETEDSFVECVC